MARWQLGALRQQLAGQRRKADESGAGQQQEHLLVFAWRGLGAFDQR
ncbi:hypothetical protein GT347_15785 [Xylophilus rhododendri]|uniref:Uncharacterized protein n=1 Tax=Xylophilus rhododendri TaxID=2697032 RepID=A0A857J6F3_9BURK|nr:hypothetical protein [Xylophilus rhododendri]QHI99307.1 hypothetical protein GT347_15785 [Xylophilus rhododendri]